MRFEHVCTHIHARVVVVMHSFRPVLSSENWVPIFFIKSPRIFIALRLLSRTRHNVKRIYISMRARTQFSSSSAIDFAVAEAKKNVIINSIWPHVCRVYNRRQRSDDDLLHSSISSSSNNTRERMITRYAKISYRMSCPFRLGKGGTMIRRWCCSWFDGSKCVESRTKISELSNRDWHFDHCIHNASKININYSTLFNLIFSEFFLCHALHWYPNAKLYPIHSNIWTS